MLPQSGEKRGYELRRARSPCKRMRYKRYDQWADQVDRRRSAPIAITAQLFSSIPFILAPLSSICDLLPPIVIVSAPAAVDTGGHHEVGWRTNTTAAAASTGSSRSNSRCPSICK